MPALEAAGGRSQEGGGERDNGDVSHPMEVNRERWDMVLIRIQDSLWPFPESEQGQFLRKDEQQASSAQTLGRTEQSQKSRRKMLCKIVHLLLIGRLRAQFKPPNKTGLDENFLNPRLSE